MIIRAPAADVHWHHQLHLATALLFIQTASRATRRLPKAAQATHIHGMTQAPVPRAAAAIHRTQKTVHTDAAAIPVVRTHAQLTLVQTCLRAHAVVARLMFTLHHVRLLAEHIPAPIQLRLNHASMVAFLCRALTNVLPTVRLHLAVFLRQALSRAM